MRRERTENPRPGAEVLPSTRQCGPHAHPGEAGHRDHCRGQSAPPGRPEEDSSPCAGKGKGAGTDVSGCEAPFVGRAEETVKPPRQRHRAGDCLAGERTVRQEPVTGSQRITITGGTSLIRSSLNCWKKRQRFFNPTKIKEVLVLSILYLQ